MRWKETLIDLVLSFLISKIDEKFRIPLEAGPLSSHRGASTRRRSLIVLRVLRLAASFLLFAFYVVLSRRSKSDRHHAVEVPSRALCLDWQCLRLLIWCRSYDVKQQNSLQREREKGDQ